MATYKHLRSSTANKRPTTSIADGQLAINTNTASPGLFFKDSAGTGIVKVGPVHVGTTAPNSVPASGGSTGNYKGEQWLDTSVSPAQMKVWNGSAWIGVVADELPVSKLQDGSARQLLQTDAAGTGVEWTSNVDVPGTLDVTSTATFDSIARHPLGTAGAPTITFTGDTNTGIYSPGADQLALSTNGTGRLFVDASGNVGLGGASGGNRLFVDGIASNSPALFSSNTTETFIALESSSSTNNFSSRIGTTSDALTFRTLNSERLRITSAGLVGIGTSSPSNTAGFSQQLEVAGTRPCLTLNSTSATTRSYSIGVQGAGGLLFWDNTADQARLFINSSGNVGIGTTSPANALHVYAGGTIARLESSTSTTALRFENTSANDGYIKYEAQDLTFYSADNERARIDSSGRLLVGTSSAPVVTGGQAKFNVAVGDEYAAAIGRWSANQFGPTLTLAKSRGASVGTSTVVSNADELGTIFFAGADGADLDSIGASIQAFVDGTPGANDMPGRLSFGTTAAGASSPTARVVIDSNGNTFLSSTAFSNKAGIQVASGFGLKVLSYSTANTAEFECFAVSTSTRYAISFTNPNGVVGSISTSASSTAYNTSSDYRLKENVIPVTDGITRLQQLKPSRFNFIADPAKTVDGFLAHEVQTIVPEAITGEKDAVDDEGNPQYQGIDQSKIVPLVVAALQEAIAKIETLEQRLNDAGIN